MTNTLKVSINLFQTEMPHEPNPLEQSAVQTYASINHTPACSLDFPDINHSQAHRHDMQIQFFANQLSNPQTTPSSQPQSKPSFLFLYINTVSQHSTTPHAKIFY